jgi:hypothetical protein
VGQNIQSETAGQLPADVISLLTQQGAERGIATGSPGSPNSNAAFLRALGLTSLDMTQRGQQNLTSILPTLPGAGIASNPGFYVNPSLNYEGGVYNANLAAAPDPMQASLAAEQAANRGVAAGRGSLSTMGRPNLGLNSTVRTPAWGPQGASASSDSTAMLYGGVPYGPGQQPSWGIPTGNMFGSSATSPVEEILNAYGSSIDPESGLTFSGGDSDYGTGATPNYYTGE